MARQLTRRLLTAIPILAGLLTLNFFLIHWAPGDPATVLVPTGLEPEEVEEMRRAFRWDEPVHLQYLAYLEQVLVHGNLGRSIFTEEPVTAIIARALPATLRLTLVAFVIQYGLGLVLGLLGALRAGTRLDGSLRVALLVLYSTPSFYLGMVLLLLLSGGVFHLLPSGGMQSVLGIAELSGWGRFVDAAAHIILPAITLGLGSAAVVARHLRSELLGVLGQEFILAARARGLSEGRVVLGHGLRNALLPIITLFGLSLPGLLGGSVVVEKLFAWPGLGTRAIEAATQRDYPLFLGIQLVFALAVIIGNLVADLLYAWVDPRIRTGRA